MLYHSQKITSTQFSLLKFKELRKLINMSNFGGFDDDQTLCGCAAEA